MSKSTVTLLLVFLLQAASAVPAGADTIFPVACEQAARDVRTNPGETKTAKPDGRGVVGGIRTVGPTFPLVCKPAA